MTAVLDHSPARLADRSVYLEAAVAGLRPEPLQTIDEWADANVELPEYVAEPGRWRTSRTPFLREIMVCLSPSHPCREVYFMKPTQIGATQSAVNWLGFVIDRALGAMLFFEPTKDLAKKVSRDKVDPMLARTPCLAGKVADARSRDSQNHTFEKRYTGGFVHFIGTNSAAGMRFSSAPYIVCDEVDAYPFDVDDEGHPVDIIKKRAASFGRYKLFGLSTPKLAGASRIEQDHGKGSRGTYHVPCPFCGHLQPLVWGNLLFTFDGVKRPEDAAYQCASCRELIPERYKTWMLDPAHGARWVHEDPDNPVRSFHINLLYQPYGWAYPWSRLAKDWLDAIDKSKLGDPIELKTFTNTILAETWEEKGETIEQDALFKRREVYEAACPAGVLFLTAAIDVQSDRLEAEVVGWGKGEEAWSIAAKIFHGSPVDPQLWMDLDEWLHQTYDHADGVALRVEAVGIDSGYSTKQVYWFVERFRGRIYALKGSSQPGALFVPLRQPKGQRQRRLQPYLIGTVAGKDTMFPRLKIAEPGPGYVHFPQRPEYDEEYFAQLSSEKRVPLYHRRIIVGHAYKKLRSRNEVLDRWIYNLATLELAKRFARVNLDRLAEAWDRSIARAKVKQVVLPSADDAGLPAPLPVATVTPPAPRGRRVISSGVA